MINHTKTISSLIHSQSPQQFSTLLVHHDSNAVRVCRPDETRLQTHKKTFPTSSSIDILSAGNESSIWQPLRVRIFALSFSLKHSFDDILRVWEEPPKNCRGWANNECLQKREMRVVWRGILSFCVLIDRKLCSIAWYFPDDHREVAPKQSFRPLCLQDVLEAVAGVLKPFFSTRLHDNLHRDGATLTSSAGVVKKATTKPATAPFYAPSQKDNFSLPRICL